MAEGRILKVGIRILATLPSCFRRVFADHGAGGWRGILYANLALIDPKASYGFFRDGINGFWDERWIDGGASRTWYLTWAAALSEFTKR
jgi:endoglucanase Acf2